MSFHGCHEGVVSILVRIGKRRGIFSGECADDDPPQLGRGCLVSYCEREEADEGPQLGQQSYSINLATSVPPLRSCDEGVSLAASPDSGVHQCIGRWRAEDRGNKGRKANTRAE